MLVISIIVSIILNKVMLEVAVMLSSWEVFLRTNFYYTIWDSFYSLELKYSLCPIFTNMLPSWGIFGVQDTVYPKIKSPFTKVVIPLLGCERGTVYPRKLNHIF